LGSEIDRKIINKCYNRINNILEEAIWYANKRNEKR
jgi:hypothetical protein